MPLVCIPPDQRKANRCRKRHISTQPNWSDGIWGGGGRRDSGRANVRIQRVWKKRQNQAELVLHRLSVQATDAMTGFGCLTWAYVVRKETGTQTTNHQATCLTRLLRCPERIDGRDVGWCSLCPTMRRRRVTALRVCCAGEAEGVLGRTSVDRVSPRQVSRSAAGRWRSETLY